MSVSPSPALAERIAAFAGRPDALACRDEFVAFGACLTMATRFTAFVREHLPADLVELAVVDDDGSEAGQHYVTVAEGLSIDWTARQFAGPTGPGAIAVPHLAPEAELLRPLPHLVFDVAYDRPLAELAESDLADWPAPPGATRRRAALEAWRTSLRIG